jgi:hypothetical protein
MREVLFRGAFPSNYTGEDDGTAGQLNRRQLLKAMGIVGAGLVLFPTELFGQSACSSSQEGWWRDTVNGLIYKVADRPQASSMIRTLNQANIVLDNSYTNTHEQYASPLIFRGAAVETASVVCGNGFQVNRLPRYDAQNPCRSVNDLNASEIAAITDQNVINQVNCVLTPNGYRTPVDISNSDHSTAYKEAVRHEVREAVRAEIKHWEWEPKYKRRFAGRGRAHTAYLLYHKTQRNTQGYPRTKFIVSSDI